MMKTDSGSSKDIQRYILGANKSIDILKRGVDVSAEFVGATYGPGGKNVLIRDKYGNVINTNDGITVMLHINSEGADVIGDSEAEGVAMHLLKDAVRRTDEEAGDGTTLTVLLTKGLLDSLYQIVIRSGTSLRVINEGLDEVLKELLEYIRKISTEVSNSAQIRRIATVACRDEKLGELIADAFEAVGKDGIVTLNRTNSFDTRLEISEGLQLDSGFISNLFSKLNGGEELTLNHPYILISNHTVEMKNQEIVSLMKFLVAQKRSLLWIVKDMNEFVQYTLSLNYALAKVIVIKAPGYGDKQIDILDDITLFCGGAVLSDHQFSDIPSKLQTGDYTFLGQAEVAKISKKSSIIIGGHGDRANITKKLHRLREIMLEKNTTGYSKIELENSIKRLSGKVATIEIGGATDLNIKDIEYRMQDGVGSVKSAAREGFVPGGGAILLMLRDHIRKSMLNLPEEKGHIKVMYGVAYDALKYPFSVLCSNANIPTAEMLDKMSDSQVDFGIDIIEGRAVKREDNGIFDSACAISMACINAFGVVKVIVNSGGIMIEAKETTKVDQGME